MTVPGPASQVSRETFGVEAAREGVVAFHRPPRAFPSAVPGGEVVIARPPALSRRGVGGAVQMFLPVLGSLGIVAFAVVSPNKLFLILAGAFVAISLLSVLASFGRSVAAGESRFARNDGCTKGIWRTATNSSVRWRGSSDEPTNASIPSLNA